MRSSIVYPFAVCLPLANLSTEQANCKILIGIYRSHICTLNLVVDSPHLESLLRLVAHLCRTQGSRCLRLLRRLAAAAAWQRGAASCHGLVLQIQLEEGKRLDQKVSTVHCGSVKENMLKMRNSVC